MTEFNGQGQETGRDGARTSRTFINALLAAASLGAFASVSWTSESHAAASVRDKPAEAVGEVVVTAQKRAQRLQDVPLSITVAGAAQLQRQEVNTIADLNRISPSLEIQQASGQNPGGGGQIRGIGTQTFAAGAVGAVGVVVDQVSQGNANISDLFDVARVEVLKGPQGTLFGLTTSAGVINIVTNAPDPTRMAASVHSDLAGAGIAGSRFGQQLVQAMVNIPLSSNSALRVAANVNIRQGVDYNTQKPGYDSHDVYGIRARYQWKPNDRLTLNINGDYSTSNDHGLDFFTITQANPDDAAALASCGVTVAPGNRAYCTDRPQSNPQEVYGLSAQIDYDLGPATVTSITSIRKTAGGLSNTDIFRDSANVVQIFDLNTSSSSSLVTEELRIASPTGSRLEYTAGVFLSRYVHFNGAGDSFVVAIPAPGVVIPIVTEDGADTHDNDTSEAVFGQATYHVMDKLRLIFGARYTHEILNLSQTIRATLLPGGTGSATENNFSFKAGGQYDFDRNIMAYVTVSQGYKGPQLNNSNPFVPANIINPELPLNVEAGLKTVLLGGKLATDLSVFYDHVRNFQGQQCIPVPTGLACGPVNYSAVDSKGVEFDVFGKPLPGFTITSGILYNPVKYPGGTVASDGTGDLGGSQLGNAPLWKFTVSGEYEHALTGTIDGYVSADAVFKSDLNLNNSLDPLLHYPAHWMLGGRLGVRTHDHKFGAAIFVRNLTDNHEPVLIFPAFPNPGDYGTYYDPQSFRLVGVSLDAKF